MSSDPSARIRWVVEQIDPGPGDDLLEVGAGHGAAVTLVAERLRGGRITALDRSAKMVAAIERRNARHIEAGRVEVLCGELAEVDFGARRFATVFALNVIAFAKDPAATLSVVRRHLAPGGRVWLGFQGPPSGGPAAGAIEQLGAALVAERFTIDDLRRHDLDDGTEIAAVIGHPA